MTDADWLAAIAAAPDDPLVRLVYADWLDDQGDPRGEQLRLDVELASRADNDPSAEPLRQRLTELVPGTDARWRAAICRVPVWVESGDPFRHPRRDSFNVDGPWYTCGECMACGLPEALAPTLLAPLRSGNRTTYFDRQPETPGEVRAACAATRACCVRDVRYGGTDPVVIQMLGNDPAYCDHLIPTEVPGLIQVDLPLDPRGTAVMTAAYRQHALRPRSGVGRCLDRLADLLGWVTITLLVTFFGFWMVVLVVQVVLHLIGKA